MDSSCTNHICNSLLGFQETIKFNKGELFLTLVDKSRIPAVAIRVVNLCFKSRVLILEDCLYVPNVLYVILTFIFPTSTSQPCVHNI